MKSSLKATLLLLALTCLITVQAHDEKTCNHAEEQEKNPPGFADIEEDFSSLESGRVLTSSSYPQMRIYANFDNVESTAPSSYASYIINELAPAVISYFEGAIRVKYPVSGNLKLASNINSLCGLNTPSDLKNGVAADYAILYTTRSVSGSILATSYNCQLASGSKRPIVGMTSINRELLVAPNGDPIIHEKNTYLLMHEMTHTLGFSPSLYKYFIDASGNTLTGHIKSTSINGVSHTVIDVPSLTTKLRNFHGCSTLPGAILATNDNTHWDKRIYLYELMQSGAINGKRVSELSLGLLEASGWYSIDYDYAEPFFYGQGQGCDFINGACSGTKVAFDEFCVGNNRGCGYMGNSGGYCNSGSDMDNCKYIIPMENLDCGASSASNNARLPSVESYGRTAESKCFTGTLNSRSSSSTTSFCFKYNCVGSGMNTQLEVLVGSQKAICTKAGTTTVSGYYGSINCPDPLTFCDTVGKQYCPRNCMGRGSCVNNQCQCNSGFTGIDCALNA